MGGMIGGIDARPTALIVSPHLDDAAFSCGGTVARLVREGWRVALATVFTASVPGPTGFALACQLDKGLGPEADYMAIRRAEDAEAGRVLGVDALLWLDLPEAPHRGYRSAAELFAGIRPEDAIDGEVARVLGPPLGPPRPDLILAPRGVGGHVDHLQVIRTLLGAAGPSDRVAWSLDLPYAERHPEAAADPALPRDLIEVAAALDDVDLRAKLDACAAYRTQLPFQFGGEVAMRSRLAAFADGEGRRLGVGAPAESFLIAPAMIGLGPWGPTSDGPGPLTGR